ncbi:MAG: hypothetical protein ACF8OB_00135 [Phycisphaeraceae bacterium JB051]
MNHLPRFVRRTSGFTSSMLVCSLCLLGGCGEEEIEVYEAPQPAIASNTAHDPNDGHDHSGHDHAQHDHAAHAPAAANTSASTISGKFTVKLPEDWQQTQPGSMILHSYQTASGAAVNVSAFPGDVGGVAANVARWRRQLGLEPLAPDQLQTTIAADKIGPIDASRVDMANDAQRMIVSFGMVDGKTWFIKLTGTAEQVQTALPRFDQFLKTVNWQ